jgi:hypothetical protein
MTGGLPSLVSRHTVRQRMGRRSPAGLRTPSANPPNQALSPPSERVRSSVTAIQTPRWTGMSGSGRLRRTSQTRLRAVTR